MSLSSTLSVVASKVIKQFGFPVVFTRKQQTSFDPAQGSITSTDLEFTISGVKDTYEKEEVNGTTVVASDIKLVIESTVNIPEIGDSAKIGLKSYRVMNVTPVDPADVVIIYEVQLRI